MAMPGDGSVLASFLQLATEAGVLSQVRAQPKVSQSCQKHSSLLSCVTRQRKCLCNSYHGAVHGPQPGTGSQRNQMNSWEKFLPAITATPGSVHHKKHRQWLVGAAPFISTALELSLSICIMMNPLPVPRKRKISMIGPTHHGLSDGPRTNLVGTMSLLLPSPREAPCIPSSHRD